MLDPYTVPDHWMPFPEIVTDRAGRFEVIDSSRVRGLPTNGMADLPGRRIWVPLEPDGRYVSRHELAHVMWSPVHPPRMRGYPGYLQAVEDARINRGLQAIGLPLELSGSQLEKVVALGQHDLRHPPVGLLVYALRAIASFGTDAAEPLLELSRGGGGHELLPAVRELIVRARYKLERARERRGGQLADFPQGLRVARWLRREFQGLGIPEPKGGRGIACCLGRGPIPPGARRLRLPADAVILPGGLGGGVRAGRMRIATAPLRHRCAAPTRGRSRAYRPSDEGAQIGDLSRFVHDQRVFRRRVRRGAGGGSVLIDASGSMSLSSGDIDRIVAGAPDATLVAMYSGRAAEGELRVIVRDGYRAGVEHLEPFGGSNVVDVPALEWLARQPTPRIWITDGGVTGCGDEPSPAIDRACERICRRARIERVSDSAGAAALLARG